MFASIRTAKSAILAGLATASLTAAGLAFATPAFAAPAPQDSDTETQAPSAEINVANVDFRSPAAVARLKLKVVRVARDMCIQGAPNHDVMDTDEARCYQIATTNGFAEIDARQALALGHATAETAATETRTAKH